LLGCTRVVVNSLFYALLVLLIPMAVKPLSSAKSEERMANSEQRLCIIGSGPAGCYTAEALLRMLPEARIDIVEKLPVPFGLIRYGVAPDHQSTKGAGRVLDRTLSRDRVRFFGHVEVGRDVTLNELREMYHVVVLATGAPRDRRLGISGEDLPGVIGSGAFVNWYNGHPSRTVPYLKDVHSAVIVGNGNVALDVARILAKGADELKGSDLTPDVVEELQSQPIEEIHIVGRRGAADAKFSPTELKEIGTLQRAKPVVEASNASESPVEQVLREFTTDSRSGLPISIHFHFGLTPVAFNGCGEPSRSEVRLGGREMQGSPPQPGRLSTALEDTSGAEAPTYLPPPERWPDGRLYPSLQSVRFRSASGEAMDIPAELCVTAIGYESVPCCTALPANGVFTNEAGKIDNGLYVVGWAKRGPSGTIPTNRAEAQQVAQKIAAEVYEAANSASDLRDLLQSRGVTWVDYAGWKRIEALENAGASDERCRLKLLAPDEMLRAALSVEVAGKSE